MYSRRRSMGAGHKKGAHYSAPMFTVRFPMAFRNPGPLLGLEVLVLLVFSGTWGLAVPATQPEADARKAEAELQSVKAEIERVARQVGDEQVEREQVCRELWKTAVEVGK